MEFASAISLSPKHSLQGLVWLWQIGLVCAGEFDKHRGTREKDPDSQHHRSTVSYLLSEQIDVQWNLNETYLGDLKTWQKSSNSPSTSLNLLLEFLVDVRWGIVFEIWTPDVSVRGWKLSTPFLALSWVVQSTEKEQVGCQWQAPIWEWRKPCLSLGVNEGHDQSGLGGQLLSWTGHWPPGHLALHSQGTPSLLLLPQHKHLLCRSINYKLKASTYSG